MRRHVRRNQNECRRRRSRHENAFSAHYSHNHRDAAGFWKVVEPSLPTILDGFYQHVTSEPHLRIMVGDDVPKLKRAQTAHWQRLFTGNFDALYYAGVHAIGLMHHKIGLEPRWYIGGYAYVLIG